MKHDNQTKYWIFQGNPKMYNFLNPTENIKEWNVTAHTEKIEKGDKVIIWISGKNRGCYALAEVITDKPKITGVSKDVHLWNEENKAGAKKKREDKYAYKCGIKFIVDLFDKPLLWKDMRTIRGLENLKVGYRGTNFSATKEEYEIISELIKLHN